MDSHSKRFFDHAPLGICVLRRDGRRSQEVLYVNDGFRAMLPGNGSRVIEGMTLGDIWPTSDVTQLQAAMRSATPAPVVLPIGDPYSDARRWARIAITRDTVGGIPCAILWATDISTSMEAETRLQQAVRDADDLASMKSNFLATMSHEIRTPMQAIFGLLELIGEDNIDERIAQMVGIAKDSASGLLEILDDVLDHAKIDADKMELDVFEVPVRTLVGGILEAISIKARGKDVRLIGDIAENVPFVIYGDPKRLRQILMNLAGNALKFTRHGSVVIRVTTGSLHVQARDGVVLRFEVIDSGIGIDPDAAGRLFTPFSQADSSTSRRFGGTGLGLSICKKLVGHMGGEIGIESRPGKGSTFWFEIPTSEVDALDSMKNLPSLDGISVLSVEDHPQGAREIKRSLESMGATVESCPTYAEGLELVKRRPFDVGIIDQGLPDGLGVDLIREIMDLRPFMGLLMYTTRDDIGLQHTLNALGIQYLPKPASRLGLGEAVKDGAQKYRALGNDGGPKRLLIAEDTASVRDILQRQLQRLGVEADFVENGIQALAALEREEYGILFTDLHMPEMDGYGLIRALRDKEKGASTHLPVIVLTADIQMSERQVYLADGFDECLLKPVSLGKFRRLLIRWGLLEEAAQAGEDVAATPESMPSIDRAAIRRQMGALDQDSVTMMRMFAKMTSGLIERMLAASAAGDMPALDEIGHSLKGAARSACCPALGEFAATMQERAARSEDCREAVAAVEQEFARVQSGIAALQPDPAGFDSSGADQSGADASGDDPF